MKLHVGILIAASIAMLSGCGGGSMGRPDLAGVFGQMGQPGTAGKAGEAGQAGQAGMPMMSGMSMPDPNAMMARMNFQQEVMKNPDLPGWYEQRDKMALAIGDRTFDKGFDRVFDSMVTALANLGCRVSNMERISGYLTATQPQLEPAQRESLKRDALTQYAQVKGYPPSVAVKQEGNSMIPDMDFSSMMERQGGAGLTLSMVKQGAAQTKVKLRFDGAYYPPQIQQLYKVVWAEVDRQMFLDKALD